MFKDLKTQINTGEDIFKKAHAEKRLLNSTEILVILESLEQQVLSQHFLDDVVICIKTHPFKNKGFNKKITKYEEVIALRIGNGHSTNQIAKSLELSKFTVESHRKNIKKKFKHVHHFYLTTFQFINALKIKKIKIT